MVPEPVTLPDGPVKLLDAAYPVLSASLKDSNVVLGGGTALEARWKHRGSTDVDLFIQNESDHNVIYTNREEFRSAAKGIPGYQAATIGVDGGELEFIDRVGSVSWIRRSAITATPVSNQFAIGTGIFLETSAEILAKTLHYRILGAHQHMPRDIYDLAWAAGFDPESCSEALDTLDVEENNSLRFSLGLLPEDWMPRPTRWPLLKPADSEIANDAVAILRGVLATMRNQRA